MIGYISACGFTSWIEGSVVCMAIVGEASPRRHTGLQDNFDPC